MIRPCARSLVILFGIGLGFWASLASVPSTAFGLPDSDLGQASGAVGGCSGGCANQKCAKGNAFFEYACQRRDSGNGLEWTKKVASDQTVAICDNTKEGGCVFGSTEKVCFTVFMCGTDRTCTDCNEDAYYVPDDCKAK